MEKKAPIVKCPACGGKSVFAPSNEWRPFCSQRCKQVDFGAWASEEFRVAGKLEDLDPSELSDLSDQNATRH
ncbi:DNA gyrase inhibitor YacG [Variovorax sp. PCZ-1]|uniref:DNA gyrase inhibitor YacG n=1 Tax=Variovorax sp. PCZ-1 TaxID=2835533 RepID=UPI0020C0B743|nr:DNA gyrase inhibitor YacG [Variovorax sp. PCZ-1]